jgi:CDP-paratose 2-epimerase
MPVAIVSGSAGLVGAEAVRFLSAQGYTVAGIDNDMRRVFFGEEASTCGSRRALEEAVAGYRHYDLDIREVPALENVFREYGRDVKLVIHTAAQPSHDWAAREPGTDFTINANGTLAMLESTRKYCPEACFIFTSTNKVYGDTPNRLPLIELESRWEIAPDHPFRNGIDETMSIDQTKHSLFGASKLAADVLVQEYGRYFGLKTGVFRGGCLTGPGHAGTRLHGFLSYLVRCAITGETYTIYGYKGKQVRDNLHCADLVSMFWHFFQHPRAGEVYNVGGGRHSNCSVLEAIRLCQDLTGRKMPVAYTEENRVGDHIWWISDVRKFQAHYPEWRYTYDLERIVAQIELAVRQRLPALRSKPASPAGSIETP